MVPEENFEFIRKTAVKSIVVFHETEAGIRLSFCKFCGVALCKFYQEVNDRSKLIVFMGTLNNSDELLDKLPEVEMWTKYRLDWVSKVGTGAMLQWEEFDPMEEGEIAPVKEEEKED